MKVKELNTIIDNFISAEARTTIVSEMTTGKKQVYHIKCDGQPIATCDTPEQANEELEKYKKEHPGKELIIEPAIYESHDDMLDKLDEMGEELDETEDQNMENQEPTEGKLFTKKLKSMVSEYGEGETDYLDSNLSEKDQSCTECNQNVEENLEGQKGICSECGGSLNEEGVCNECNGMKESKKKTLRLTETELANLVVKMVTEAQKGEEPASDTSGMAITKKAQTGSKKENEENLRNVNKKIKKYLSFTGNDNPEFPHPIGKGDKVAVFNSSEEEDEIAKNVPGPQNLDYDLEPSEGFKKRMKMSREGDSTMGNALGTKKASIKPSNGADIGKEAENVNGNKIPSNTAKKMEKQIKGRAEDKEKRVLYPKEKVPISESKLGMSNIVQMEIEKMKNLTNYNKKTQ